MIMSKPNLHPHQSQEIIKNRKMSIDITNINEILEIIPSILQYFIPGFIFLTIRNLSLSIELKNDKFIILNSIVISFILVETLKLIPIFKNSNYFVLIPIIAILFISKIYIGSRLEEKIVNSFVKGKITNEDIFSILLEQQKGAWLRVYIRDVIYVGKIHYTEDVCRDGNRYIILFAYQSFNYEWEILEDNSTDNYARVMLNMKDIDIIEKVKGT